MGCICPGGTANRQGNGPRIRRPRPWAHTEPITRAELDRMREEFWDTQPHYGGTREIWDALRAATEADLRHAQAIIDSAGIIVHNADLTRCYDERGAMYELPLYVLSDVNQRNRKRTYCLELFCDNFIKINNLPIYNTSNDS